MMCSKTFHQKIKSILVILLCAFIIILLIMIKRNSLIFGNRLSSIESVQIFQGEKEYTLDLKRKKDIRLIRYISNRFNKGIPKRTGLLLEQKISYINQYVEKDKNNGYYILVSWKKPVLMKLLSKENKDIEIKKCDGFLIEMENAKRFYDDFSVGIKTSQNGEQCLTVSYNYFGSIEKFVPQMEERIDEFLPKN